MFYNEEKRAHTVKLHAEKFNMSYEEAEKHVPPIKDMNCPDCYRKHIAAAMGYAKEIINGHGPGGHPDHRPDFAGEVINAEHHAEFINAFSSEVLRKFRHKLDLQKWLPDKSDINTLRSLWLESEFSGQKSECKTCGKKNTAQPALPSKKRAIVDVVIPLWPGGSKYDELELRFALRSIDKYLKEYRNIIVLTDTPPKWLKNITLIVDVKDSSSKNVNMFQKMLYAAANSNADYLLSWCDDFILQEELKAVNTPALKNGHNLIDFNGTSVWHRCLKATGKALKLHDRSTLNCESHTPALLERKKFLQMAEIFKSERIKKPGICYVSLYHNFFASKLLTMNDFKTTFESECGGVQKVAQMSSNKLFIGYNDKGFNSGVKEYLQQEFQQPSRFEVDKNTSIK